MADDSNLPSPGDILAGKYRIERLIGRGGMGAVFAAEHMLLNQRVAVKLLLGDLVSSQEATARFMNEARAAAKIQGDHVARVLDIGQLPTGTPYMVLEYLEGSDVAGLLQKRGVLTVAEVADYALQALDALAQAHAAGIVHRDLKPANLFLAKRHDGSSVIKVLDFGISKNLSPVTGTPQGMTQTRAILGSPEYMSPEQLRTPRDVDTRTDIWSLGVILYELLTGRMPFTGEAIGELFMQIMEATPPPLLSIRPEVPAALDAVVTRCLNRDPNARFQTVGELAAVLRAFASDQMRAIMAARESSPGVRTGPHPVAPTVPMIAAAVTHKSTAAPWSSTGMDDEPTGLPDPRRSRMVATVAGTILVLILGLGVTAIVRRAMHTDTPAAGGLTIDSTPSAVAIPTASAAAVSPDAGNLSASHGASGGATGASKSKPGTVSPSPQAAVAAPPPPPVPPTPPFVAPVPPPAAPAPPPAAATPPKNCNPDYYFDKDGRKHFKPECF